MSIGHSLRHYLVEGCVSFYPGPGKDESRLEVDGVVLVNVKGIAACEKLVESNIIECESNYHPLELSLYEPGKAVPLLRSASRTSCVSRYASVGVWMVLGAFWNEAAMGLRRKESEVFGRDDIYWPNA